MEQVRVFYKALRGRKQFEKINNAKVECVGFVDDSKRDFYITFEVGKEKKRDLLISFETRTPHVYISEEYTCQAEKEVVDGKGRMG